MGITFKGSETIMQPVKVAESKKDGADDGIDVEEVLESHNHLGVSPIVGQSTRSHLLNWIGPKGRLNWILKGAKHDNEGGV